MPKGDWKKANAKDILVEVDVNHCWNCISHYKHQGYPQIKRRDRKKNSIGLHRWIYELLNNKQLNSKEVLRHKCDNPACINPFHLEIGSQKDNMKDMKQRNRNVKGEKCWNAKLKYENIEYIRSSNKTQKELGREFGVCRQTISSVQRKKNWKEER